MKVKPNTEQFQLKKDPTEFLESGTADIASRTEKSHLPADDSPSPVHKAKVYREQKVFRLPLDLINGLKREAYEQSIATGSRVTETELVEQWIRIGLKL